MVNSPASYEIITSNRTGETPQTVYSDLYRNHLNVSKDMVNRWTEEKGTGVKYPRIIDSGNGRAIIIDQYNFGFKCIHKKSRRTYTLMRNYEPYDKSNKLDLNVGREARILRNEG